MLTDKRSLSYVPLMLFPLHRTVIPPRIPNSTQSLAATGGATSRGDIRTEFPRNPATDKPRHKRIRR